MTDKKECFIIMPITTPDPMVEQYRDGKDHFRHVLDCLFKPAVEKAGYVPKPPIAKGSDLIHAEIIKNLEKADIVLCDMSCLNPNVFFEFGIRTSLNKPVCVVKDELTKSVPFDTGILNYQEYNSTLEPWLLEQEIKKLSEHLTASADRSKGVNTLWKYFGLKGEAAAYKSEEGNEGMFDYISLQLEALRDKVDDLDSRSEFSNEYMKPDESNKEVHSEIVDLIRRELPKSDSDIKMFQDGRDIYVHYNGKLPENIQLLLVKKVRNLYKRNLIFTRENEQDK